MKRLVCAAFAAALLMPGMGALSAQAKGPMERAGGPPREKGEGMAERAKEKLGLTDEQETKFKDAMKEHGEAVKPLHRKMRDGLTKLGDQVQDKASDSDIKATLDSLKSVRQAMTAEEEKFHDTLASFLTPTQQAKLVIGMAKRMHEGMMGPGGRPGMMGPGGKPGMGPRGGDRPAPKDEEKEDHDEKGE